LKYIPAGIYFDKSLAKNKLEFFRDLKKRGFKIISIDEEGLSSRNNMLKYVTQRISPSTLMLVDKVFTWGKSEKDIIVDHYPSFDNKIVATGNVRVDLFDAKFVDLYENIVNSLIKQYGRYILFPSSFSVNHASGVTNQLNNLKKLGRIKTEQDYEHYSKKNEFFRNTYNKYYKLVETVANTYKDCSIIIRPHPSEDRNPWKKLTKINKNVFLRTDFSISPWIYGSKCVVHSSCTTGLEAFLMSKPVISYLPYTNNEFVKHISNDVSVRCYNSIEVLEQLKMVFNDNDIMCKCKNHSSSILKDHLSNYSGIPAYQKIKDEIEEIDVVEQSFQVLNIPIINRIKYLLKDFNNILHSNKGQRQYNKQKLPYINEHEIIETIGKYQRILPEVEDFDFKVKKLGKDLFLIN